jgi:glycosyltransferase involved in cell wall biosynthesis
VSRFGPDRQQNYLLWALQELQDGPHGVQALQSRLAHEALKPPEIPELPDSEVLFSTDSLRLVEVTVVVPLYNYASYVLEALNSVRRQTLRELDLIVIDDASTDQSAELVLGWMKEHALRFNRALLLRNRSNAGLALSRNAGFDAAETAFVLPLDADNRLRPTCCEECLGVIRRRSAGFAYPTIQTFGDISELRGVRDFLPTRFINGNYVDAMALVGKWAWLRAGGYMRIEPPGWEDFDFWCRCIERGIGGVHVKATLADYRVHRASMLHTQTDVPRNKDYVISMFEERHAWLRIARSPA